MLAADEMRPRFAGNVPEHVLAALGCRERVGLQSLAQYGSEVGIAQAGLQLDLVHAAEDGLVAELERGGQVSRAALEMLGRDGLHVGDYRARQVLIVALRGEWLLGIG